MDAKKLKGYAELIVRVGAAVQPGQDVVVCAELDQPSFVELVVEECYKVPRRFVSSGRIRLCSFLT